MNVFSAEKLDNVIRQNLKQEQKRGHRFKIKFDNWKNKSIVDFTIRNL